MFPARGEARVQLPRFAVALALAGLVLSACATQPAKRAGVGKPLPHAQAEAPPRPRPAAPPPADQPMRPAHGRLAQLSDLRGWAEEDHLAALQAFQAGCAASRDPSIRILCSRARNLGPVDDEAARRFLEASFRAEGGEAEGVLTAYFAPEYEARFTPDAEYSAAVRAKPGRSSMTAAQTPHGPAPTTIDELLDGAATPDLSAPTGFTHIDLASADRRQIETAPPNGVLAWMKAEDLFFLQIQGSGTLRFPDGRRLRAAYSGDNGKPFVAIARPMVEAGLLGQNKASGDGIRGWLAAHRGPEAQAVMWKNPRYVFFSLAPDDGKEPAGAAGIPLPAGRALAVDPSRHAYGEVWWIDAEAPILAGANAKYRRLAMALDTGSAIRGEVRADLYIGRGDQAGLEAGRVRHTLRMMRLVPVEATAHNDRDETDLARR